MKEREAECKCSGVCVKTVQFFTSHSFMLCLEWRMKLMEEFV